MCILKMKFLYSINKWFSYNQIKLIKYFYSLLTLYFLFQKIKNKILNFDQSQLIFLFKLENLGLKATQLDF